MPHWGINTGSSDRGKTTAAATFGYLNHLINDTALSTKSVNVNFILPKVQIVS